MPIVIAVVLGFAAVVLWALQNEEVPPEPARLALRLWTGLPDATDIRRADFPLAIGGYDRAAVHAHLDRVAVAYDTVLRARAHVGEEVARAPAEQERAHAHAEEERDHAPVEEDRDHAPVEEDRDHAHVVDALSRDPSD